MSATTPTSSQDLTWLFLPEELDELYESKQPQPGDVLLLNSGTATGKASRLAQSFGHYSHVGIVIGSDLYIDAISGDGARVRFVEDIPTSYDIEHCNVARNRDVVLGQLAVWTVALDYFARPYKLRSIFMKTDREIEEKDPVICSKLVAMILNDMGKGLGRPVQRTLPKHIDEHCGGSEWRRFPLTEYDLIQDPKRMRGDRKTSRDLWFSCVPSLHNINQSLRSIKRRSKR